MESISSLPQQFKHLAPNPSLLEHQVIVLQTYVFSLPSANRGEIGFMTDKILQGIKCSPETCIYLFTCYHTSCSECFIKYSVGVPHFCGTWVFETRF